MLARSSYFACIALGMACGGTVSADAGTDATIDAIFLCDMDACDGLTHYCNTSSAGAFTSPGVCTPLPDGCMPASCACLPNADAGPPCSCAPADSGNGFNAGCSLP